MQTTVESNTSRRILNHLSFWSSRGLVDTADQYASQFAMIFGPFALSDRLRATLSLMLIINQRLTQLHNGDSERLLLHNLRDSLTAFYHQFSCFDTEKVNDNTYLKQRCALHAQPEKDPNLARLTAKPCRTNVRIRFSQLWQIEQLQAHRISICRETKSLIRFDTKVIDDHSALHACPVDASTKNITRKLIINTAGDLFLIAPDENELLLTNKTPLFFCGYIKINPQGYPLKIAPCSDHYDMDDTDTENARQYLTSCGLLTKSLRVFDNTPQDNTAPKDDVELRRHSLPAHEFVYDDTNDSSHSEQSPFHKPRFRGLSPDRRSNLKKNNSMLVEISPSTQPPKAKKPIRLVRVSYVIKDYIEFINDVKMWCLSHIQHQQLFDALVNLSNEIGYLQQISRSEACPESFYKRFERHIIELKSILNLSGELLADFDQRIAQKPWRLVPEKLLSSSDSFSASETDPTENRHKHSTHL